MARWSDLIWDGEAAQVEPVQAPVQRPAPVMRPGSMPQGGQAPMVQQPAPPAPVPYGRRHGFASDDEMRANNAEADALAQSNNTAPERRRQQQAQEAKPQPKQERRRWSDDVFDGPQVQTQQQQAALPQRPVDPNAEPDAGTWVGRRVQDFMGKTDKRYGNLPALSEIMLKEKSIGEQLPYAWGEAKNWMLGASDEGMGRVYKDMLGERFVGQFTDANGYPIIRFKGRDGQDQLAYVNKPGVDPQDVMRGAFGVLPFAGAGLAVNAVTKGAGLGVRAATQAAGQASTSLGTDAARAATGVDPLDASESLKKAVAVGALGAGGEVLGAGVAALYRRFVTEPRLYNAATGQLTEKGIEALKQAGVDPSMFSPETMKAWSKEFARTGDAAAATKSVVSDEFGIPRTAGELSGSRRELLREQQMRGGTYGDTAETAMRKFDDAQRDAVTNATRGTIAGKIAPERAGTTFTMGKGDAGVNIRANTQSAYDAAKQAEGQAWAMVPSLKATSEALTQMDAAVAKRLAGVMVDESVTPAAARMAKELEQFKAGKAPDKVASILPDTPANDVGVMRKRLLAMRQSAATPEDKRAARALYDSFLDWEVMAAETAGDMTGAAASRTARSLTRQVHEIFDGKAGTHGARILGQVLKEERNDSAEGVVNALFAGPTADTKLGSIQALQSLKKAYQTYLEPEAAKAAWNDIRLAYWQRISNTKGGETQGYAKLSSSIKNALESQRAVVRLLYSPEETKMMRRLAFTMDQIKQKNPNTSWSGIAVGALARDAMGALVRALGWESLPAQMAVKGAGKPVAAAYGMVQSARATGRGAGARTAPLPLPSYGWAGGAAGARSQEN